MQHYLIWQYRNGDQAFLALNSWKRSYVTALSDGTNAYLFDGTTKPTSNGKSITEAYQSDKWKVASGYPGWITNQGFQENSTTLKTNAQYHSIRFYNRTLSDAELAHNRTVDEARFHGVIPQTNVIVRTQYLSASGNELPGVYQVDGSHTFTRQATVETSKATYSAAGYTIETFANGEWSVAQEYDGNSYDYVESQELVRLTWKWTYQTKQNTLFPTVGDYVQDGLVAQYDGIRNAGRALAHDATATIWKNIATSAEGEETLGCDLAFKLGQDNAATDPGPLAVDIPRTWTNGNAYAFDGTTFAQMNAELTTLTGKVVTIEMALGETDVDVKMCLLRTSEWYGIFTGTDGKILKWQYATDSLSGSALDVNIASWTKNRCYLTALADGSKAYLFQGTSKENGGGITGMEKFRSQSWKIAAGFPGWENNKSLDYFNALKNKAQYHSVRFYNRALSNEELAQNREVDEARFHGKLSATNVVVASELEGAHGVERNGAYLVTGSWTFTAAPMKVNGEAKAPSGYTLETRGSDGTWSEPIKMRGNRFVYDEISQAGQTVRLTWRWTKPGFSVIVR